MQQTVFLIIVYTAILVILYCVYRLITSLLKPTSTKNQRPVIITVEGGLIQDIQNIPCDVVIIIQDYDTDGTEEPLKENYRGESYIESIYKG